MPKNTIVPPYLTPFIGKMVFIVNDWDRPQENRDGILTGKRDGDYAQVDNDYYMIAAIFPVSAREEVTAFQKERARLKKIYDDSMSGVYELCNKKVRGEFST